MKKMVFLTNFQSDTISKNQTGLQVKKVTCLVWHPTLSILTFFPWFTTAAEKQIVTFLRESGFMPDAIAEVLTVANDHDFWGDQPLSIKFCEF